MRKAVVLARGLGTRMRRAADAALSRQQARAADAGTKALIPVGRPFLDFVLSALADAGLDDVCLVIGPEHDVIRDRYTREVRPSRMTVAFAIQREARGTADAVLAAEAFAAGDPFLVLNSDNYYPVSSYAALRALDGPGVSAFTRRGLLSGGIAPERLASFAVLDLAADGTLRRIVEKPGERAIALPDDAAAIGMNCWRFGPRIFQACRAIGPSPRGEWELPDAVQHAIERLGERFTVLPFDAPVLDLSTRHDIAPVARALESVDVRL